MTTIDSLVKEVKSLNTNIRVRIIEDGLRIMVSGNTYPVKGRLKLLGFQWDSKRREWYYAATEVDLEGYESELFLS